MSLAVDEKRLVLNYLNSGEPIAAAAGCALNHTTNEYTDIPMIALSDGKNTWTSEDIYNLEKNDEVFDELLIQHILKKSQ